MFFLVELDHVKSGQMPMIEEGRTFIEQIIFPTIAHAEQLIADGKILTGGPVAGGISLRLMVESDSLEDVDQIISSLPLWTVAETRVTPLIAFTDRRKHVKMLFERLAIKSSQQQAKLQERSP
jgi:muconolactone delta-isomerase